jgi:hypothetical protein
MTSLGEQTAFFCSQTFLSDGMRRVFLGAADPVARVVVGETGEDVNVLAVDGDDQNLNPVAQKFFRNPVGDKLAKLSLSRFSPGRASSMLWRVRRGCRICLWVGDFVVAFAMFAMVSCAPSARVAAEPGTVDVDGDVVPVVEGLEIGRFCTRVWV